MAVVVLDHEDLVTIRDIACRDAVAIAGWSPLVDSIASSAESTPDRQRIKDLLNEGKYEYAILQSLEIWLAKDGTFGKLITVFKAGGLNRLANELEVHVLGFPVERKKPVPKKDPERVGLLDLCNCPSPSRSRICLDCLVATPRNMKSGIRHLPFWLALALVALGTLAAATKATTGEFMRFHCPSVAAPLTGSTSNCSAIDHSTDMAPPPWKTFLVEKPDQMPQARDCPENYDVVFHLDGPDEFETLNYPAACDKTEEFGDIITVTGEAPFRTILIILLKVAGVVTKLRVSELIIQDDCTRQGDPLLFSRLTGLELHEIKGRSSICIFTLLASSKFVQLETIRTEGVGIAVQNSCHLRKLISLNLCGLTTLYVDKVPHNNCDSLGIMTPELCDARHPEFRALGEGGNAIFQGCAKEE